MQETRRDLAQLNTSHIPTTVTSNPLENQSHTQNLPTTTLPAREVLHSAEAALRPILNRIRTQEELNDLLNDIDNLR